ncbi:MAG: hypothetical protein FJ098_05885 [Deltaproteobacteria bacterium]|nr:hypothetical protein [Deltaproteobacteria bacterium]
MDENYLPDASCGTGACQLFNTPSACQNGIEAPCLPGPKAAGDETCDGLDDDCDGLVDEHWTPEYQCGKGWCRAHSTPSACSSGTETACVTGPKAEAFDLTCDGIDGDCDGQADEDAVPECPPGLPVIGAPLVFETDTGLVSGLVTDHQNGTYSSSIVGLTRPGVTALLSAGVPGGMSGEKSVFMTAGLPHDARLMVSSGTIYPDGPGFRACISAVDEAGFPATAPPSIAQILVSPETGSELQIEAEPVQPGLFCAWLDLPEAVMQAGGSLEVVGAVDDVVTDPETVSISPWAGSLVLGIGELGLTLPQAPVEPGVPFEVPLTVTTGGNAVGAYSVTLLFDPTVLQVQAVLKGAATDLSTPATNLSGAANATGVLTISAINLNPSGGLAQGEGVELARVRFVGAADVATEAAVSGFAQQLLNTLMLSFLAESDLSVLSRNGIGPEGLVHVEPRSLRGLHALLDDSVLLDPSPLAGEPAETVARAYALYSDGALEETGPGEGLVCTSSLPELAIVQGCDVTALAPGSLGITASLSGFSGEATLRILGLELPLSLSAGDTLLEYIVDLDAMQETRVRAFGTYTDGALFSFVTEVTDRVLFSSSAPSVAKVTPDGSVEPGANGQATVLAKAPGGEPVGSLSIGVLGDSQVTVEALHVVVPGTVSILSVLPAPVTASSGQGVATARVTSLLSGEGSQVQTRTLLLLSDDEETGRGSRIDLTHSPDLSFQTGLPGVGVVDASGLITATGEGSTTVSAQLEDPFGGVMLSTEAPFDVVLSPPVAVTVEIDDDRVSVGAGDRASTVLGLPVTRPLQVTVHFEDGRTLDMTHDPRTNYAVIQGNSVSVSTHMSCVGVPGCLPGTVTATGLTGTSWVFVTFPGTYMEGVTGGVFIHAIAHQSLTLKILEPFTPEGAEPAPEVKLSFIENTSVRQRGRLLLRDLYSDGSTTDWTLAPEVTWHTYAHDTSVPVTGIALLGAGGTVTGQSPGVVDVVADHQDTSTAPVMLTVSSSTEDLLSLSPVFPPGVLSGAPGVAAGSLSVVGTFKDGTHRLLTGADHVPGLLEYWSSKPSVASVNSYGVLLAQGNGSATISVDVFQGADAPQPFGQPGTCTVGINLTAVLGDVDLGETEGLPFPNRKAGEYFPMPVRVNTGPYILGAVDLQLTYNPQVLKVHSVASGMPFLEGGVFSENHSTPGVVYLNGAPSPGASWYGASMELATITFEAKKTPGAAISPMGGTVRGLVNSSSGTIGAATPRAIVAGAGDLDPAPTEVLGDADDDGVFSVRDLLFLLHATFVPPLVVPNPTQAAQSDLFPDGELDLRDAVRASQILARLSHFVTAEALPAGGGGYDLRVYVTDREQLPFSTGVQVLLEVAAEDSEPTLAFTLPHQATEAGVLTQTVSLGTGVFGTHVSGLAPGEDVEVAVILLVIDEDWEELSATAFLSSPWLDPGASFEGMFSFN